MIMEIPPALELREQDTATLYAYIQYLQSEIERTQIVLRERNADGQIAFTELPIEPARTNGLAPQVHPQEAPYQTIVEEQLDPICRFQADFRLTFVNEPYAALYGKAPQELIGKNLLSIVPSAYQQQVIDHLATLTAQHPVAVDENPAYLADGSMRWFHWTNRLLTYADGTIEYQGVGRDITERKQAEEAERKQQTAALQTAEAKFQQLFDAAPVAILVSNQAGQITLVNQQAEALLGYEAAELLQQPVVMLVPEAHRAAHPSQRAQFTAELNQHAAGMTLEAVARRKDGSPIPIEIQVKYIQTADERLIMSFFLDITERKQAMDALQQQRNFLQTVIDHIPGIITVKNRQGEFQLANQYMAQHVGLTPATLVGKTGREINPNQAEVQSLHQATAQVFATQQPLFVPEALIDGRYYQVNRIPLPGPTAADDLVLVVATDITERKQAKDALRQQRDFLQTVIDHIPGIITVKNRQGKYQLVNQYTAQFFGMTREAMLGKTNREINPNLTEAERVQQATDQVLATQQALFVPEHMLDERYYQVNMLPLPGSTPADDLVLVVATDITERKQVKDALRQQRDFLQTVIDHIPGIITVKNRQGEFRLANKHTAQHFGLTPEMLVGKTSREVNPNQHEVDLVQRGVDHVLATKQTLFVPEILLVGRYYEANFIPLPDTMPTVAQVLFVAHDITERKQSEVALQQAFQTEKELSALKSGFITTTSHEFRTPLAVILSTTETLLTYRRKLSDTQIEQRLTRITSQVQHLKGLMEDVLDLSRMQTRRFNFAPTSCDPASLGRKLITDFQNDSETSNPFVYTFDANLPLADLDERLLRYILNNLLSNALKYSADDTPVAIHFTSEANALILTVSDKGRGIPAADLKHLFQPFYRATNVENIPGTGLGLSIIKEAIELHQGSITVESQVGVGTTFTVTLPLAASV